ncbi:MAG TPA: FAD-dependent oxidoreductase [Candidatus Thermoplasmatota archaeon]|nr:FAD-dependent oxidoreductase [Candidatus Thermoplasmatota archaeon]
MKKENQKDWSLPEETKEVLSKRFKDLDESVHLAVFTKKGENDEFNQITQLFVKELSLISEKITVDFHTIGDDTAKKYNITRSPTIIIQPEKYHIWYIGAPFGEEGRSFIDAVLMVSQNDSRLSQASQKRLAELKEKRHVMVFVTLSCPYCPGQVINGFKAAIERPDLISAECVDASEQMELSQQFNVGAVPHTVINEESISKGLEPEEKFIEELITLKEVEIEKGYDDHATEQQVEVDLIVVGAGPAGLTAGIYGARSGLETVVIEKGNIGGQVSITPIVENWPGFKSIPGRELMEMITAQTKEYVPILENEPIHEIKVGKHIEAITSKRVFRGKALILSTGTTHRKLGVHGEESLYGRGVSYCATCDGYLYKNKQVIVVGGGNSALTDALYLHNIGARVTIVHRHGKFRAEHHLQQTVNQEKINVLWDSEVKEISGSKQVEKVVLFNNQSKETETVKTDAVFVSIGETPMNQLAGQIGLKLDESGYVRVDRFGRTNIPRLYAAGDITGGVRQIVTAVGEGATAATSSFEDISHPYWQPVQKSDEEIESK